MKGGTRAAVAIGVGYLLGRRHKIRIATIMAVAAAAAGTDPRRFRDEAEDAALARPTRSASSARSSARSPTRCAATCSTRARRRPGGGHQPDRLADRLAARPGGEAAQPGGGRGEAGGARATPRGADEPGGILPAGRRRAGRGPDKSEDRTKTATTARRRRPRRGRTDEDQADEDEADEDETARTDREDQTDEDEEEADEEEARTPAERRGAARRRGSRDRSPVRARR